MVGPVVDEKILQNLRKSKYKLDAFNEIDDSLKGFVLLKLTRPSRKKILKQSALMKTNAYLYP